MDDKINLESAASTGLNTESTSDINTMISDDIELSDSENLKEDGIPHGYISLPSGRALSLQETYDVMAMENTVVVILIGPSECGKTTLETTLYQMFQLGKVSNYSFAGSKTIQGYEKRAFYTRINSKQDAATTPRTPRGLQELFLHLRLLEDNQDQKTNYLFADLSGEDIHAHMANVESIIQNIPFIKHADSLTFILDGRRLITKNRRNSAIAEVSTMIRTIFDAELYTPSTKVQLVISKYDLIEKANDANTNKFIENSLQELSSLIQSYISDVTIHKVAAMPEYKALEIGFGMDALLTAWKYDPPHLHMNTNYHVNSTLNDEFNKLFYKLAGDVHE